jgi:hypothetical protein
MPSIPCVFWNLVFFHIKIHTSPLKSIMGRYGLAVPPIFGFILIKSLLIDTGRIVIIRISYSPNGEITGSRYQAIPAVHSGSSQIHSPLPYVPDLPPPPTRWDICRNRLLALIIGFRFCREYKTYPVLCQGHFSFT